jgi:hypothetical protein
MTTAQRQAQHLGFREHQGALFLRGRGHVAGRAVPTIGVEHLLRLPAGPHFQDRGEARLVQQRLEDLVFVRVHGALDHVLAQAPGGIDQHDLVEAGLGVDGEHHARAGQVRAHHPLDADRQRDLQVIEALDLPIADRPVGEQRGVAATARLQQGVFAADVEEALLLSGEARVRQVLRRGAGADGHVGVRLAGPRAEVPVGRADRGGDGLRNGRRQEGLADGRPGVGERDAARGPIGHRRGNDRPQTVGVDEAPVGLGRGGEPWGNADAPPTEVSNHLTQRGVLAADARDVASAKLIEWNDQGRIDGHRRAPGSAASAARRPASRRNDARPAKFLQAQTGLLARA